MERLTTNKPVAEMGMYELAHNSCYIDKYGATRYRDFEADIDARDLARNLMVDFGEWSNDCIEMIDDDSFDWAMLENLANAGVNQKMYADGLIALFYRNLWAMAELREKLKNYEQLEEQGLLLKLPCKVGDECYVPNATFKRVFEVYCISISKDKENIWVRCGNGLMYIWNEEIFATKEEAEAKLKELQEKEI